MLAQPLPRDVKKAIELLRGDLARSWRMADLARLCGVGRRTLEKHFRRFAGCAPLEFLQTQRLERVREKLVRAPPKAGVTGIAMECGFSHLGRFSLTYRDRYGESPSATLRYARASSSGGFAPYRPAALLERPALAILPFDLIGAEARHAADLHHEIAFFLGHTGWAKIVPPLAGRYHLRGSVRDDGFGRMRVRTMLLDRSAGGYIWADRWECNVDAFFASETLDWLSRTIASALRSIVRDAEMTAASTKEPDQLTAWQLTMRALPMVLAADPATHATALDLLDLAIEHSPRDPLPLALAAWCHSLRAGHHFTKAPEIERKTALDLATRASLLGIADPLAEAMLSAGFALTHDLASAERHARHALAIDGGSAWAWGRLAWVHAYRGESPEAIECCRIARALCPQDPLQYLWSIGIASANFEQRRYSEAVRWYLRALEEEPKAVWINRFLAPACELAGYRDAAHRAFGILQRHFPDLTIAQVKIGVPNTPQMMDRLADGLESLGMPVS
jgi:AraC-like DNA-binding protein/tetratricopeptide (TPR) repeat protein